MSQAGSAGTAPSPLAGSSAASALQGYLAHHKMPTPLELPQGPGNMPRVLGDGISYEQGTPPTSTSLKSLEPRSALSSDPTPHTLHPAPDP